MNPGHHRRVVGNAATQSISGIAALTAVLGSGFLGLNPALVTVHVTARADNLTDIQITGIAKEGLIKQHAGEKAAKLIAAQLAERLPPVPA